MAKHRTTAYLAAGEMEMLQVLWSEGPVTIAEAQRALDRPVGYTTVQTRLNRLVAKGIVARSKRRPAKYHPLVAPEEVSARHLDLLLERVSGGNVVPLVAHLVQERSLSAEEIENLKRLVAQAEREHQRANSKRTKP
jgi:BlaI family penicillinase repressor